MWQLVMGPQTSWELIHQARKEHPLKSENLGIDPEGKQELETNRLHWRTRKRTQEWEGRGSEESS